MPHLINLGYALVHALLDLARAGVDSECRRMTGPKKYKVGIWRDLHLFFLLPTKDTPPPCLVSSDQCSRPVDREPQSLRSAGKQIRKEWGCKYGGAVRLLGKPIRPCP